MPVEYVHVAQQRLYIALELAFIGLRFNYHVAIASVEIELAVGRREVVEFLELDAGGAQFEVKVFKVAERVESG